MSRQIKIADVAALTATPVLGNTASNQPNNNGGNNYADVKNFVGTVPAEWSDLRSDGSFDLSVRARVGDEVEVLFNARLQNGSSSGPGVFLDYRCVTGSSNRMWSNGLAPNTNNYSPSAHYNLIPSASVNMRLARRVLAEDLDPSGFVTLRLQWRANGGTPSVTVYNSPAGGSMQATIRNFGSDRRPALMPSLPFHFNGTTAGALQEASVWQDSAGGWNMLYTGGVSSNGSFTGWATATSPAGPWTDKGQAFGGGVGGEAGVALRNSVYYDASLPIGQRLTVFYSTAANVGDTKQIKVAQGNTPLDLAPIGIALAPSSGIIGFDNSSVIKDGNRYVMMVEGSTTANPNNYVTGFATSPTLTGPYTIQTFPIPALQISANGMAGGPALFKVGATYVLWYHAGLNDFSLPTEIMRATSTDLVNWVRCPTPIIRRSHPYEVDQCADVFPVVDGDGNVHLFWTAFNNVPNGMACIMYADPMQWRLSAV